MAVTDKIPFQFSLHIEEKPNSIPKHFSFLAGGSCDPRLNLLSELKRIFRSSGNTVTYNQSFEKGVLQELAEAFPENKAWVDNVCGRLVDLLHPLGILIITIRRKTGVRQLKKCSLRLPGKAMKGWQSLMAATRASLSSA